MILSDDCRAGEKRWGSCPTHQQTPFLLSSPLQVRKEHAAPIPPPQVQAAPWQPTGPLVYGTAAEEAPMLTDNSTAGAHRLPAALPPEQRSSHNTYGWVSTRSTLQPGRKHLSDEKSYGKKNIPRLKKCRSLQRRQLKCAASRR